MTNSRKKIGPSRGRFRLLENLESRVLLTSIPTGAVDTFTRTTIAGYAINKDDGQFPQTIEVTVNGTKTTLTADDFRSDLTTKLGSPYHAFSFTLPTLPAGNSTILVQAVSPSTGAVKTLRSGTIANPPPKGKIELFSSTEIKGYAYDTDSNSPIQIRIDVDGVAGTPFTTNVTRDDLVTKLHTAYDTLGFNVSGNFAGHVVEVYAYDAPTNTPTLLYTNNGKALGKVEANNGLTITGYALDPDTTDPITIRVTVDGTVLAGSPFLANIERDDLVKKYGSDMHGFSLPIPSLTPGLHIFAFYAIDAEAASAAPVFIGSTKVTNTPPTGHLDTILNNGTLTGWALDKDLGSDSATVNLYVDDQSFATTTANLPRTDIHSVSPTPDHGFSFDISSLSTSSHAITLTVVDNSSNENEVVFYDGFINNNKPTGKFEPIVNDTMTGWAFDQDDPTLSDPVDVYIDGVYKTTITADQPREDVDAMFPTPDHAFSAPLPVLSFGTHKIDLYAAESQGNVSVLIGSQTVKNVRPISLLEVATPATLSGYAIDPDHVGQSVQVQVYINGTLDGALTTTANLSRPDLLTKSPFSSDPNYSNYGFSIALPSLPTGRNQIDVYAVDPNNGLLTPIGSRAITV